MSIVIPIAFKLALRTSGVPADFCALNVVAYHRVLPVRDELNPNWLTVQEFRNQLRFFQSVSQVVSLERGLDLVLNQRRPGLYTAISFDDGYRDNFLFAKPILDEEKACATIFVASKYMDGTSMFNDLVREAVRRTSLSQIDLTDFGFGCLDLTNVLARRKSIQLVTQSIKYREPQERDEIAGLIAKRLGYVHTNQIMMAQHELCEMVESGNEIGSHTHDHVIATTVDTQRFQAELEISRKELTKATGAPVKYFAFPNGKAKTDFLPSHVTQVANAGYHAAFSTEKLCITQPPQQFWSLPRFTPWGPTFIHSGFQLAQALARSL